MQLDPHQPAQELAEARQDRVEVEVGGGGVGAHRIAQGARQGGVVVDVPGVKDGWVVGRWGSIGGGLLSGGEFVPGGIFGVAGAGNVPKRCMQRARSCRLLFALSPQTPITWLVLGVFGLDPSQQLSLGVSKRPHALVCGLCGVCGCVV